MFLRVFEEMLGNLLGIFLFDRRLSFPRYGAPAVAVQADGARSDERKHEIALTDMIMTCTISGALQK